MAGWRLVGVPVDVGAAREFVMGHARLLDRRRFQLAFDGGRGEDVVSALMAYRNPDGGFGNAVEPDLRGWSSQPIGVQIALETLLEVEQQDDDMVESLLSWCAEHSIDGGLPFALPEVRQAPRAPWWAAEPCGSVNPTASVVGLARALGSVHPWLDEAEEFCWRTPNRGLSGLAGHEALCVTVLAAAGQAPAGFVDALAEYVVGQVVALDPATPGYVLSPLQFAPTPDSLARGWFDDEVIDAHLDALTDNQQDDGGWPITWDPPTAGAVTEWRGQVTVNALNTLRAYGRA